MTEQEIQAKIEAARNKNPKISKPTMKVKDIISHVEKLGYLVKLTHYRYFGQRLLKNADIHVLLKALKIMGANRNSVQESMIMGRGGMTSVEVLNPHNDVKVFAKAECSLSDNFVYSKASRLALYRVLDQLPDKEVKDLRKELENMYLKYQIQVKEDGKWVDYKHPYYSPTEDKAIAENEASAFHHETGKKTRVVSVFE